MLYFESENELKFYNLEAWKCNGPTLEQATNTSKHYSSFDLIILDIFQLHLTLRFLSQRRPTVDFI